jgi:nucleoside-diphosphate-sugar epimerase
LVDSTYIDNAASGVVAAMDRARDVHGQAFVLTNGQPRPVGELMRRIVMAAGMVPPTLKVPFAAAKAGGSAVDALWARRSTDREPPMTRFLAEQLGTAHWFDQRETQAALRWKPSVSLSEGFVRLKAWFDQQ